MNIETGKEIGYTNGLKNWLIDEYVHIGTYILHTYGHWRQSASRLYS